MKEMNKLQERIKIEEVRKIINDLYHDCQSFDKLSPTYPDRMRTPYYKEAIIDALRRFSNSLDNTFLLLQKIEEEVEK